MESRYSPLKKVTYYSDYPAMKKHCVRMIMMKIKYSILKDGDTLFGLPTRSPFTV